MAAATRTPAFCTQCRSRCGCVAVVERGRLIDIAPLPGHPTGDRLCPKGRAAPELVYHPDRLTRPLKRTRPKGGRDAGWVPIGWEEALDEIASRMVAIGRRHGPEQVAFSVTTPSGSHISDSIAWIERLIRVYGSPNTIYGTEICNWHKDFATRFTFGHDIGTPDFAHTDCVLLWGNNPTATWLARSGEIHKALKRGARLIVVDPRPTLFARRADQWLQVRPGTDQALALGLAHLLITRGRFDQDFARRWTNGPLLVRGDTGCFLRESDRVAGGRDDILYACADDRDTLLAYDAAQGTWLDHDARPALRATITVPEPTGAIACRSAFDIFAQAASAYPPERVAHITGVDPAALTAAAETLGAAPSVAYYAWNGVGQSTAATQTDRAISILYALTGSYGKAGGNVPGGAAPFIDISGPDLLPDAQRAKALGLAERPLGPGLHGWVTARDVYRAVLTGAPYPIRMLISFGTNLLVSQPDTQLAQQALERLEFHVHADFFLNPTAQYADIVLPAATSWEREGLRTGFDVSLAGLRKVQLRPPVIAPLGEARPDTDIVLGLAARLGLSEQFFGCDADRGHDAVLANTGLTVEALRAAPAGIEVAGEVPLGAHAAPLGVQAAPLGAQAAPLGAQAAPLGAQAAPLGAQAGETTDGTPQGFPTPTRRVEIYSERLLAHGYAPVPSLAFDQQSTPTVDYPLRLGGAKTVAYCHSQHRNIASLRRLVPDPVLEMAAADAETRCIAPGDWVRVRTAEGTTVARASIVAGLTPGAVFGQHGWWVDGSEGSPQAAEGALAANINRAISTAVADPVSGSIPLRCSWCEVERL